MPVEAKVLLLIAMDLALVPASALMKSRPPLQMVEF